MGCGLLGGQFYEPAGIALCAVSRYGAWLLAGGGAVFFWPTAGHVTCCGHVRAARPPGAVCAAGDSGGHGHRVAGSAENMRRKKVLRSLHAMQRLTAG